VCPSNANCPMLPAGQILDNGLRVLISYPPDSPFQFYTYRTLPQ
jgi:hypothetical protein